MSVRGDWLARLLVTWTGMLAARRAAVVVVMVLMGVAFSWMSSWVRWEPDVLAFFSADSAEVRDMRAAAGGGSGLVTQLRVDVHGAKKSGDGSQKSEDVRTAARALAARLMASGDFRGVWSGVDSMELAGAYGRMLGQTGGGAGLLEEGEMAEISRRAEGAYLSERFAAVRARLADPDGEILLRQLAADPLGVADVVSKKMRSLSPGAAGMEDGLLVARDAAGGEHVMLVLEPKAMPSDQRAAAEMMERLWGEVRAVEREHGVGVWVVGAHRAYVENARQIKRDVAWVSVLGTLGVAAMIVGFFRQRGAGWKGGAWAAALCVVPASIGIGMALGIAGMMRAELPLILLGFAGLLCGSTTDYGIQIFAECGRLAKVGGWDATLPARAARNRMGAISMSVITSALAFGALALSGAPGLRAMGLFVALASVCIWVVTFWVMPAFIGQWVAGGEDRRTPPRLARVAWWMGCAFFVAGSVYFGRHALVVTFNKDPRALDGSSAELRAEEEAFYRVWGDLRNRAVVQVRGRDAGEALARLDVVQAYLSDQLRDGLLKQITSPPQMLPSDATLGARAEAWQRIWTPEKRSALRDGLAEAARANGMRAEAITAYADRVGTLVPATAEERLAQSPAALIPGFVERTADGVAVSMLVQMNNWAADSVEKPVSMRMSTAWAPELRVRFGQWDSGALRIYSGNVLIFDATERARAEGERLAPWCVLAILLPLWIYFRRLRRAWLVMLCLAIGFLWVLGAAQMGGMGGLNLLSLVPVLFTLGVAVDYGIYRAQRTDGTAEEEETLAGSTALCALSTMVGSGALVFAEHPAMRWLGITLVAGVLGGYWTSVYIVGMLRRRAEVVDKTPTLWMRWLDWPSPKAADSRARSRAALRGVGRMVLRLSLLLITVLLALPIFAEWRMSVERPRSIQGGAMPAVGKVFQEGPRAWRVGESWMRWREAGDSGLWEMRLAGHAYERGRATALLAGPQDVRIENEMLDQMDRLLPSVWSRWGLVRGMEVNLLDLSDHIPLLYQEEIYGAASLHQDVHRYLGPTYPRILAYHALHDLSQMLIDNPLIVSNDFACTGVISLPAYSKPEGGHLMLGRVFDFEGGESFGRQKSIAYVFPGPAERQKSGAIPFAHVAWPGLSGVVTGMNAERIAIFINAAGTRHFARIGAPSIFVAREVLEQARTLDDAEDIIRAAKVFVSDIFVIADGKTGEARVLEKSPGGFSHYSVAESMVVTNHLVTPVFADDPVNRQRIEEGTTTQRYARARELLDGMKGGVTVESLAGLMRDKKGAGGKDLGFGNRNAIDGLIACHGVIMDVTSGWMWVSAWPHVEGRFVGVNVLAMLQSGDGENIPPVVPEMVGEDSMMVKGPDGRSDWDRVRAARRSAELAGAALARKDGAEALRHADEVIRENGQLYLGHELRGRALLLLGRKADAKAGLQRAMTLDPPYLRRRQAIEGLIKQCDVP